MQTYRTDCVFIILYREAILCVYYMPIVIIGAYPLALLYNYYVLPPCVLTRQYECIDEYNIVVKACL